MTSDVYYLTTTGNDTTPNWGTLTKAPCQAEHTHTAMDRDYEYDNWDEKPKERNNMRALYRIYAVNPKTEAISGPYLVVAKDERGALLKADIGGDVRIYSDEYDFIVDRLGDVRAKKDVQKVKIVEKGEE